jgi:hypothetical protein
VREAQGKDEIFVGKPIPASQVARIVYVNPEHVAALKEIPIGYLLEVKMTRGKAQSFVERLERAKAIKHGEYRIRSVKEGEKEKVMILHAGSDSQLAASRKEPLADVELTERVRQYVLNQPNYQHHIKTVADALGVNIDGHDKNRDYRKLDAILQSVRTQIEAERKDGHFVENKEGRYNVYKWETS